ncbi:MAG: hypothetical protein QF406_07570 [Verrucomicrobiota bacterium]|jgi:hypothetical protein|nr:hypothetical protein [Verrucomicrobiota bacterium]
MKIIKLLYSIAFALLLAGCGKPSAPAVGAPSVPANPVSLSGALKVHDSAKPNDFEAVTSQLDAGGDLFLYWNAGQVVDAVNEGLKRARSSFSEAMQDSRREQQQMNMFFDGVEGVVKSTGFSEIKGVGASSLAVEKDLFRNRVYLMRDREAEPGVLWQIIDGEANAADGLKFAPESTVFAHYTNADVEVAMETLRDVLMQGGAELMPWEVRRMMEPLMEEMMGNVSVKDILAKHFSGELTEESKPFVGRWKTVHSRESKPAEILRRPDGTFVLHADNDELEGFWKVEEHKMYLAIFYHKGEIAPLERLRMIVAPLDEVTNDGFVTGEIEMRQLYNGHRNQGYDDSVMEPTAPESMEEGEGIGREIEDIPMPDRGVNEGEEAPMPEEAGGGAQIDRNVEINEDAPSLPEPTELPPVLPIPPPNPENCEEPPVDDPEGEVHVLAAAGPGPDLERPKRPFFTETRLAKFTGPKMVKYNDAKAMEPVDLFNRNPLKYHFSAELTPEAKPFVGRWSGKDNDPNNSGTWEMLRRSNGTYANLLSYKDDFGKQVVVLEEGFWKVEGKNYIFAPFRQNSGPVDPENFGMYTEPIERVSASQVSTKSGDFKEFPGGSNRDSHEHDHATDPAIEDGPGPDAGEAVPIDPTTGLPLGVSPAEVEVEYIFTETRVEKFKGQMMAQYNDPAALEPLDLMALSEQQSKSPIETVLSCYGGAAGLYFTLDDKRTLPFKHDKLSLSLPQPGVVMVVKLAPEAGNLEALLKLATGLMPMSLKKEKAGDVTLFTVELPEEMPVKIPLNPTLFQLGQHVVLTSDTSLAREIIAVHSGQSTGLAGTDEFKRLSADLKVGGQQLQFVSARAGGYLKLLKEALPVLMAKAEMDKEEVQIFSSVVEKFLGDMKPSGHLAVLKLDEDGLLFDGRATGGGYRMAVTQSILIPMTAAASAILGGMEEETEPEASFATIPTKQIRELTLGLKLYMEDNGKAPAIDKWGDAILHEVGHKGVFLQPGGNKSGSSYALNAALKGWKTSELGPDTVLVFQSAGAWNHSGGLAEAQKTAQENGRVLIGFCDGNVRVVPAAALARLNWNKKKKTGEKARPIPPFPTARGQHGSAAPLRPDSLGNKTPPAGGRGLGPAPQRYDSSDKKTPSREETEPRKK